MATSSIFEPFIITDPEASERLITAIISAHKKNSGTEDNEGPLPEMLSAHQLRERAALRRGYGAKV